MDGLPGGILDELARLAGEFEIALGEEESVLRARDAGAIDAVVATKTALLGRLEAATGLLAGELRSRGASADRAGLASALTTPAARQAWRRVQRSAVACVRQNQTNGAIVQVSQAFNAALLGILRGDSGAGTYDRDGRLASRAGARAIASA
ncbi:MAG: flagellar protein FlgN [Gammaproteobacteria bacterium]|nr:flagellar protein FlgN [Gammaproteobacteria bacterium]